MKILVDINVFEDVFRLRQGWEASLMVINDVRNKQAVGYVSAEIRSTFASKKSRC